MEWKESNEKYYMAIENINKKNGDGNNKITRHRTK